MIKEKQDKKAEGLGRRDFLTVAGVGVGAVGVAVLAGGSGSAPAAAAAAKPDSGYRETEHVRRFYQLARF